MQAAANRCIDECAETQGHQCSVSNVCCFFSTLYTSLGAQKLVPPSCRKWQCKLEAISRLCWWGSSKGCCPHQHSHCFHCINNGAGEKETGYCFNTHCLSKILGGGDYSNSVLADPICSVVLQDLFRFSSTSGLQWKLFLHARQFAKPSGIDSVQVVGWLVCFFIYLFARGPLEN